MGELERDRLAMETELADNVRLSCQIRVNDDLKVRVVNQASVGEWIWAAPLGRITSLLPILSVPAGDYCTDHLIASESVWV